MNIYTALYPHKVLETSQPTFWRYLRNDSLSNSFITFTHGHPLIQNNGPASQEKEVTTLGVISRSLNDSTQRHTREGVRYRLDISWSHFKEQRGELPPGSAELFKNVISLIRVPMAHPNHNCQHAPRNTIRNLHMLPNFFFISIYIITYQISRIHVQSYFGYELCRITNASCKVKIEPYMLQTFEIFLVFISNNLAKPTFQFVQNTFARMY